MSQTLEAGVAPPPASPDERVTRRSPLARLLTRPEVGALLGAIVIYLVFFSVAPPFRDADSLATILYVSSTYGIPTVAVAMLMIGRGPALHRPVPPLSLRPSERASRSEVDPRPLGTTSRRRARASSAFASA